MKTADGYELSATMNTDTEKQAQVLSLILRIGIVTWMKSNNVSNAAQRLKTISVAPDGTSVRLKGVAVSDAEIMPLILTLLNGPPAGAEAPPVGAPPTGTDATAQPATNQGN